VRSILVTGGFGFIGSHLVERLLADPETAVHVVDNLISSPIDVPRYVRELAGGERLTYDIRALHEYHQRLAAASIRSTTSLLWSALSGSCRTLARWPA